MRDTFLSERAGWAHLGAFATSGAISRVAPVFGKVADQMRRDSPRRNLPYIRALNLRADSNATGAEDAPVLIQNKAGMAHVDG